MIMANLHVCTSIYAKIPAQMLSYKNTHTHLFIHMNIIIMACSQFHHLLKTVLLPLVWVGNASE